MHISVPISCLLVRGDAWGTTPNAFLFSLHNKQEGLGPFKSIVKWPSGATYSSINYGPTFGGGHDIYVSDNANTNGRSYTHFGHNYPVPGEVHGNGNDIFAGTNGFTPDAIEVFYLG